mgnify:CR=1 FL=1
MQIFNNLKITGYSPLEVNNMHYVYLLKSSRDGRWYTGYTNDLQKRILEHNQGKNFSTKNRRPFILLYYETCIEVKDAK